MQVPPPPVKTPVNNYEQLRVDRMRENIEKFVELGLDKFVHIPNPSSVQISKGKEIAEEKESSDAEYIMGNESESEDDGDAPPKVLRQLSQLSQLTGVYLDFLLFNMVLD